MRTITLAGVLATALAGQAADAFDLGMPTSFRGFRVEANGGGDRFQSESTHKDRFGYGATVGFDGTVADRIVVGAEGSYWRANHGSENNTSGINGGAVHHKSFQEYGAAIRAGYLITPKLLIFGKGGYVSNEQRKSFVPTSNLFYVNGRIVGPEQGYYTRGSASGFQAGGGAEYSLTRLVYVDVQYVYSGYDNHSARQKVLAGVGVRFK